MKENWQSELVSYLRSIANKPFCWRRHNCFIFWSDAVEAMTGVNYGEKLLGEYIDICHDAESARLYLESKGYRSHVHLIAKNFKARPSKLNACRGDTVILRDLQGAPALGICQGEKVYVLGENNLMTIPMENARKVFSL